MIRHRFSIVVLALVSLVAWSPATFAGSSMKAVMEHYDWMSKHTSKMYVKTRTTMIDVGLKKAASNFWDRSSECFFGKVETYRVGLFKDVKVGTRQYTPKMKYLNKSSALFGLQVINLGRKGKDANLYIGGGKPPKDGMVQLSMKFEAAGKNKTRLTSYFGWGGVGKHLAKSSEEWAAGKNAKCPTKYM